MCVLSDDLQLEGGNRLQKGLRTRVDCVCVWKLNIEFSLTAECEVCEKLLENIHYDAVSESWMLRHVPDCSLTHLTLKGGFAFTTKAVTGCLCV